MASSTELTPICPHPFTSTLWRACVWTLLGLTPHTCQIKGKSHFSHCKTAVLRWNPIPPGVTGRKCCTFHPMCDSLCHSFCFKFSVSFPAKFPATFFSPQHVFTTSSYVIFETSWNINAQRGRINKMVVFKKVAGWIVFHVRYLLKSGSLHLLKPAENFIKDLTTASDHTSCRISFPGELPVMLSTQFKHTITFELYWWCCIFQTISTLLPCWRLAP